MMASALKGNASVCKTRACQVDRSSISLLMEQLTFADGVFMHRDEKEEADWLTRLSPGEGSFEQKDW